MAVRVGGHRHISDHEHDALIRDAVRVEQAEDPLRHHPVTHTTHTVKKMVEVPYEETIRVPVEKKVARPGVETKVMRGVELIPVKKYKDVHETVMEVKEEEVRGVREVWVRKQVPYTEIVKKPVKVTKTRRIPYTDYQEKEIEVTVDVPCHKIETHTGFRDDTVLKTKFVEVEQDVTIEHRPIVKNHGRMRVRDSGEHRDHGVVQHGTTRLTGRDPGREHITTAVHSHSHGAAFGPPVGAASEAGSEFGGSSWHGSATPRGHSLSVGRRGYPMRPGSSARARSVYGAPSSARGSSRGMYHY